MNSININKGTQYTSTSGSSVFAFIFKNKFPLSQEKYQELIEQLERVLYVPLRIMAVLVAMFGSFAMIFEVKYFPAHSIDIYLIRLCSTLIAFIILATSSTGTSVKRSILLIHVLLLTIIISSGIMTYLIPSTILVNSSIVGLMIFSSALFLSWELKHQIIVAIYYNLIFAASILFNNHSIYFLPNMKESVLFVLFLSVVSVVACAVNFRMRIFLAERNLQIEQSDQKYRSIIDNSMEGIFQTNLDGRFITINQTFTQILGYSNSDELIKLNIKDLYENKSDREKLIEELLKNEKVENYRVRLKRKDGSTAIVRLNDRVIKDTNNETIFEGNIYDITEQVRIEEERHLVESMLKQEKEKNEKLANEAIRVSGTKSKFLANLSHEIRTPINGILGFLSLIEAGAYSNEKELNFFSTSARQSTESLLDIINSVLDLSKIEAGKIKAENVRFNLINVIDQAISVVSVKANEKNIRIVKDIPESVETFLISDMVKLRQIFTNLLNNAVKFTVDGEIKISIRTNPKADNEVELSASITDTGIGIPESKLNELFKPYSQIGEFFEGITSGTGLGLVICKEYVELLGGKIGVNSIEGEGSSFNFTILSRVQSKVNLSAEIQVERNAMETNFLNSVESHRSNGFKKKREKFKLLLAEDNLINQKVTIKILNTFGFNVSAVCDGIEAINAVTNENFDLVLMDLQMPNVDGFKATEKIRLLPNPKCNIPIIALTAHALLGDKEKCLNAGMTDYLSKPVSGQELVKKIDVLLDIRKDETPHSEPIVKDISPLLDKNRLKNVSLGDYEFEKDLLSSFVSDLDNKYKNLIELTSKQDIGKIIEIAHSIKGSSYSIGAAKVADEAYAIELSGKNNDWMNVNDRIEKFSKLIDDTNTEIENYLNEK